METVDKFLGTPPQPLAATEFDWRNGDMHRVDGVGVEAVGSPGSVRLGQ